MAMKTLPSVGGDAQWDSKLLKDLSFIKKKLRYPFGYKTLGPIVLIAVITALVITLNAVSYLHSSGNYKPILLIPLFLIPFIVSSVRYFQSLRFVSIATQLFMEENRQLVQDFLEAQHLVVFRHPNAPEVFQIISKSIDQYKDRREVMIFIADDKRILINSHFTNQGFTAVPAALHRKDMGKMLKDWIDKHSVSSNTDRMTIDTQ